MQGIQGIIRLSQIDHEIKLIEREIESADDGNSLVAEIQNLSKIITQGESLVKNVKNQTEDVKLQLEKANAEKKKIEATIYAPNNSAKKIDELQDHAKKISKFIDDLETKSIELMEQNEKYQEKLAKARKLLEAKNSILEQKTSEYKKLKQKGEIKIAELQRNRNELKPTIENELITIYDKLLKTKSGVAMVEVTGNQCNGCQQTIPSVIIQATRDEPDELHYCNNCGRLIYIRRNQ
jgi:predicted  nucleic acid-binding Zn-ribbon protein